MCSSVVGPEAPKASVAGGARCRTPKVKTPEITCPSAEIAVQRTVYAPRGSRLTGASIVRLPLLVRVSPETRRPLAE